ncbi:hypothetical protein DVH24_009722, partial [Malus domestica]
HSDEINNPVLTLILLWRTLLSSYDTSASINPDCLSTIPSQKNVLFHSLALAIESSIVWDSVNFVWIVEYGYEYEQTYAFFPLLPLCMSFLSRTAYGYNNLCLGHLPSDVRPWCKARVPLLYNYIQSHYWYVIFNHQCLLLLVSYPSAPPLYWFASYIMKSRGIGKRWGYIVWAYSAAYILLGSLLFSNFYPFT